MADVSKHVNKNIIEYIQYLEKACVLKHPYALNRMGILYTNDITIGNVKYYKNIPKAIKYYKKSAYCNYSWGYYNLASKLLCNNKYKKAFKYYLKAYKLGCKQVTDKIGDMYFKGQYVEKNDFMAYKWYKINNNKENINQFDINVRKAFDVIIKQQAIIILKDYFNNDLVKYIMRFY